MGASIFTSLCFPPALKTLGVFSRAPLGPIASGEFFRLYGTNRRLPHLMVAGALFGWDRHDNSGRSQPPRDARSANAPGRGGSCASILRVDLLRLTHRAKLKLGRLQRNVALAGRAQGIARDC